MPFKVRHLTPHKSQVVEESAPYYVKILKAHCEEKRCQSAARSRRDIEKSKGKKKVGEFITQSGVDLNSIDPYGPKYCDEAFRLQGKLNEAFPVKLLYSNRSKYGL